MCHNRLLKLIARCECDEREADTRAAAQAIDITRAEREETRSIMDEIRRAEADFRRGQRGRASL